MTIKGLFHFLKHNLKYSKSEVPLTLFSGCKIVIDCHNLIYRYKSAAHKVTVKATDLCLSEPNTEETMRRYLRMILNFLISLISYNITPILVFEGKSPEIKNKTVVERYLKRIKLHNEVLQLQKQLTDYNPLDISPQVIRELRKKMANDSYVTPEEAGYFFDLISSLGIPCVMAPGEAERFCAMLVQDKYARAIFSRDSDCLAHGCPIVLTKLSSKLWSAEEEKYIQHVECYVLQDILEKLELTFPEFRDFCILCGCDYNTNIKGIGPVNALRLIKKYKAIDALDKDYDISILNHKDCEDLFTYEPTNPYLKDATLELPPLLPPDGMNMLKFQSLSDIGEKLHKVYLQIHQYKPKRKARVIIE